MHYHSYYASDDPSKCNYRVSVTSYRNSPYIIFCITTSAFAIFSGRVPDFSLPYIVQKEGSMVVDRILGPRAPDDSKEQSKRLQSEV